MAYKIIIKEEITVLLQNLNIAKSNLNTPYEYLGYILKNKYSQPKYTDEDWNIINKERNNLETINEYINDSIDTIERFQKKVEKIYTKRIKKTKTQE